MFTPPDVSRWSQQQGAQSSFFMWVAQSQLLVPASSQGAHGQAAEMGAGTVSATQTYAPSPGVPEKQEFPCFTARPVAHLILGN